MLTLIVTGGSRGIGLGIVRALSREGYRVIAVARTEGEALAELSAQAVAGQAGGDSSVGHGPIHFRACDLGDVGGLANFVRSLREEFGAPFGLVNNAGLGTPGVLATMTDAQIERLVRMNTLSPLTLTRHVVRAMLVEGVGRIVNIASVTAATGYPGLSVYSATKASLIGFTRSLAREIGPAGITVNAVSPGFIQTEMTQEMNDAQRDRVRRHSALRRLADVDDIAEAVVFLLSDKARNITGTVLTVDAGSTA